MVKGWLDLNGREYYFSSTGEMYSNGTYTIGGVKYKFDKSGLLIS
jgi:glucan-binding YG repeat protein